MSNIDVSRLLNKELKHGRLKEKVNMSLDVDQYQFIENYRGNLTAAAFTRALFNLGTKEFSKMIRKIDRQKQNGR